MQVHIVGRSAHEHTVGATINGQPVGTLTFSGAGPAVLTGTVSATSLQASGNELALTYAATSTETGNPDDSGLVYLDSVDLQVPLSPGTAEYQIAPYQPALPSFEGVQYLVVTHPLFQAQAARLAQLKEAEGLRTAVVDVERAYDAFSGGVAEAAAVQALVRRAAQGSGQLKYLVLVGDDTFDNQDYLGTGVQSFIPSLLADDGEFGRIPSENRYADTDGDGRPEVAIGRLPVQTVAQAEALVTKIAGQQAALAAHSRSHAFAVDKPGESDAPFRSEAEEMAVALNAPASTVWADVAQGVAGARTTLQDALATGSAATHYFGHGSIEVWSKDILLDVDELEALPVKPTVLFTWGCESQFFQNLWGPSLNEAFVLKADGGAVASFGPAGITPPAAQQKLYRAVYGRLGSVRGITVGEAIRQAKAEVIAAYPEAQLAVNGFSLLGDPAVRLPLRVRKPVQP